MGSDLWSPCRGPPGIGKTRLVRESVSAATSRGFEVISTYCESHTREISFHVISRLLRAVFGIGGLTTEAARMRVRAAAPNTDAEDLLLLDELLGIRDTDMPLPEISPDARRAGGSSSSSTLFRWVGRTPPVYVIEGRTLDRRRQRIDAHRFRRPPSSICGQRC